LLLCALLDTPLFLLLLLSGPLCLLWKRSVWLHRWRHLGGLVGRLLRSNRIRGGLVGICVVAGVFIGHSFLDSKAGTDRCVIAVFK
jgi:hypothetical protein